MEYYVKVWCASYRNDISFRNFRFFLILKFSTSARTSNNEAHNWYTHPHINNPPISFCSKPRNTAFEFTVHDLYPTEVSSKMFCLKAPQVIKIHDYDSQIHIHICILDPSIILVRAFTRTALMLHSWLRKQMVVVIVVAGECSFFFARESICTEKWNEKKTKLLELLLLDEKSYFILRMTAWEKGYDWEKGLVNKEISFFCNLFCSHGACFISGEKC